MKAGDGGGGGDAVAPCRTLREDIGCLCICGHALTFRGMVAIKYARVLCIFLCGEGKWIKEAVNIR